MSDHQCSCGHNSDATPPTEEQFLAGVPDIDEGAATPDQTGGAQSEPQVAAPKPPEAEAEIQLTLAPEVAKIFRDVYALVVDGHTVKIVSGKG